VVLNSFPLVDNAQAFSQLAGEGWLAEFSCRLICSPVSTMASTLRVLLPTWRLPLEFVPERLGLSIEGVDAKLILVFVSALISLRAPPDFTLSSKMICSY
jgi:hypothetical protein